MKDGKVKYRKNPGPRFNPPLQRGRRRIIPASALSIGIFALIKKRGYLYLFTSSGIIEPAFLALLLQQVAKTDKEKCE